MKNIKNFASNNKENSNEIITLEIFDKENKLSFLFNEVDTNWRLKKMR